MSRRAQLSLAMPDPPRRCPLCGRKVEKRCKWCEKGGAGDPPSPAMKAWRTWRRGLERVLVAKLKAADLSAADISQAVLAVFYDRGEVPPAAHAIAAPYLARPCSERRYGRIVNRALLAHQIHEALFKHGAVNPKEPWALRFADVLAGLAADVLIAARAKGITRDQRSDVEILNRANAALREAGIIDPDRTTPWKKVDAIGAALVNGLVAEQQRRVRIEAPRLRFAAPTEETNVDLERELEAEDEARAVAVRVMEAR